MSSYEGVFKVYGANEIVGKSKYDGVDLESVAYWQVHPEEQGQLQLCDKDGQVLHRESVRTQQGERSLNRGSLRIINNGKSYSFKRHPNDKADLEANGFAPGSSESVQIKGANGFALDSSERFQLKGANAFAESLSLLTMEVAKQVVCWRIHPARKGFVQLIDTDGHIVHVAEVLIRSRRKRLLRRGFLGLNTEVKAFRFKRHPDDKADLEKNGFLPGQKPKVLDLFDAPIIVEEDVVESRGMDAAVIEISDEPEAEMSGDISVPEYNSDSESSDDELVIDEE